MNGKIHAIRTGRDECRASVIATLEEALRQAREDNDIVAVAIAVVRPTGAANTAWSETDVYPMLLGAAALLQARLAAAIE